MTSGYGGIYGVPKQDCPNCGGSGDRHVASDGGPPKYRRCECTLISAVIMNMRRALRGLPKTKTELAGTALWELGRSNIWATASRDAFRQHLYLFMSRQSPDFFVKVITDVDLAQCWLGMKVYDKADIIDPEVAKASLGVSPTLLDLVGPPDLLIVYLGVKGARNSAMPELLMETLADREFNQKPMWLVDQPSHPLVEGHMCYSAEVETHLRENSWRRVILEAEDLATDNALGFEVVNPTGSPKYQTRAVEINVGKPKKDKDKKGRKR